MIKKILGTINCTNFTEIAWKICNIYDQGVITDHYVWDWFLKFHSGVMLLREINPIQNNH